MFDKAGSIAHDEIGNHEHGPGDPSGMEIVYIGEMVMLAANSSQMVFDRNRLE